MLQFQKTGWKSPACCWLFFYNSMLLYVLKAPVLAGHWKSLPLLKVGLSDTRLGQWLTRISLWEGPWMSSPPGKIVLLYIWNNCASLVILISVFLVTLHFPMRTKEGVVLTSYNWHLSSGGGVRLTMVESIEETAPPAHIINTEQKKTVEMTQQTEPSDHARTRNTLNKQEVFSKYTTDYCNLTFHQDLSWKFDKLVFDQLVPGPQKMTYYKKKVVRMYY